MTEIICPLETTLYKGMRLLYLVQVLAVVAQSQRKVSFTYSLLTLGLKLNKDKNQITISFIEEQTVNPINKELQPT